MRIKRVLNNNAVVALNGNTEMIALGSGIAFRKDAGDLINENAIEKAFYPESEQQVNQLTDVLSNISPIFIQLSDEIIKKAIKLINKEFSNDIYVSLPDHLQFALERAKKNMKIENKLTLETSQIYPKEFEIGKFAIELIHKTFDINLSMDEATNVAMHFITAESNNDLDGTMATMKLVNSLIELIENKMEISFDKQSSQIYRLMIHLNFYAMRVLGNEVDNKSIIDSELYNVIKQRYSDDFLIAQSVSEYVKKKYNYDTTKDEIAFLSIHIRRIRNKI